MSVSKHYYVQAKLAASNSTVKKHIRLRPPYRPTHGPAQGDVHGILLLDKPAGMSSNKAMQSAMHLFGECKTGHTGSLDPLATGMLPLCFGEATKIAGYLLGAGKAYVAECRLGATTDTDDADGTVLSERVVPAFNVAQIETALIGLRGDITQIPPVYSAIKQAGLPLYKRARQGEEVQAAPRQVNVQRFDLLELRANSLSVHVECGSGTYVRSLVRDLGEQLGCGAHLTALRRLWVEPFREARMLTLKQLQGLAEVGALHSSLLPLEAGLQNLPLAPLHSNEAQRLRLGQRLIAKPELDVGQRYQARDERGHLVALVECRADGCLWPLRGFNPPALTESATAISIGLGK